MLNPGVEREARLSLPFPNGSDGISGSWILDVPVPFSAFARKPSGARVPFAPDAAEEIVGSKVRPSSLVDELRLRLLSRSLARSPPIWTHRIDRVDHVQDLRRSCEKEREAKGGSIDRSIDLKRRRW